MTPKERCDELVNRFYNEITNNPFDADAHIRCAIIAVQEVVDATFYDDDGAIHNFYREVLLELYKLKHNA